MYSHNLGLSQDPFSIAPDPRFLFMSERHREALAHLLYGVSAPGTGASSSGGAGGGFVLLTGDIGTGKTTICRCFLEQIPASCRVAYIFNPRLTVSELLQSVCEEFHIATAGQPGSAQGTGDAAVVQGMASAAAPALSLKQHIDALNAFLLARHAAGESCVLIIDEAQNLLPEVLEQLRLLTNLETNERKLLQIVLIGQPELRTMLQRPELEQLAQRVIARYHLNALNEAETHHYIAHRLAVAGHTGTLPFDARAMTRIHAITRGVPRRINLLCGRALLGAWAHGQPRVNRAVVDKAALEVFGPDALAAVPTRLGQPAVVALAGLVLLGGAAAAVYWSGSWPADPASASSGASAATQTATLPGVPSPGGLSVATTTPPAAEPATATASGTAPVANATPATDAALASAATATASVQGATGGNPATSPQALAATPPSAPAAVEADTLLPRLATQQATAWRSLGAVWLLPPLGGDPCQAAVRQQLQCFQAARLTLPQLRQLGRPGILTLAQDGQRPVHAVLVGLGTQTATLQVGKEQRVVRLASLGRLWQGDFATFWQPPPGFAPELRDGSTGPTIDTLASLLTRAEALEGQTPATAVAASASSSSAVHAATGQRLDAALRARVRAFQRTQGLSADGQPGPLTFMQLESALGLHTQRLLTD